MLLSTTYLLSFFGLVFACVALGCWLALTVGVSVREKFQENMSEEANMNLSDMFMFVDPTVLVRYYTIALGVVPIVVLILTRDGLTFLASIVIMAIVPRIFYGNIKNSRMKKFNDQLPDAFMSLASSLGAGTSLMGAVESLVTEQPAPLSQEFSLLLRKIKLGVNFDEALIDMEKRIPLQDFKVALSAIRISREVGGNLVGVMEKLAETLRQKAAIEGKIVSLTSQGKAQGYVMTGLPIVLGIALKFLEPEAMGKLFSTNMGYMFLAVIITMLVLGFTIIRKITTIDV